MILGVVSAPAATIPYTENFNDDPVGTAAPSEPFPESGTFVETTDSQWSVVAGTAGNNYYRNSFTPDNTVSRAMIDFAGSLGGTVSTASNFAFSGQLIFRTGTVGSSTSGLAYLLNSAGDRGYLADLDFTSGNLRFVRLAATNTVQSSNFRATGFQLDTLYTISVTGTYVDTNSDTIRDALNLTLNVIGAGLSGSAINFTDNAPYTNTLFGLRDRTNASNLVVDWDSMTVSVPEPGTASFCILAGLGALTLRRRRKH